MGFEGIRFDYSKGYGGKYAGDYARAALGDTGGFVVGEYWVPLAYDDEGEMIYDQEPNRKVRTPCTPWHALLGAPEQAAGRVARTCTRKQWLRVCRR